jgi:hypothetical protein
VYNIIYAPAPLFPSGICLFVWKKVLISGKRFRLAPWHSCSR